MNKKLHLNGVEFCLQEWTKCNVVSKVKFVEDKKVKSNKLLITRAPKKYSTLF